MTRARWWDGCDRAVVAVSSMKPIGGGHSVRVLALECGHSQVATSANQTEAAICRECVRIKSGQELPSDPFGNQAGRPHAEAD